MPRLYWLRTHALWGLLLMVHLRQLLLVQRLGRLLTHHLLWRLLLMVHLRRRLLHRLLWALRLRWRLLTAQRLLPVKQIQTLLAHGQLLPLHSLLLLGEGLPLLLELLLV